MKIIISRWNCTVVMEFCGKSGTLWMARSSTGTLGDAWIFSKIKCCHHNMSSSPDKNVNVKENLKDHQQGHWKMLGYSVRSKSSKTNYHHGIRSNTDNAMSSIEKYDLRGNMSYIDSKVEMLWQNLISSQPGTVRTDVAPTQMSGLTIVTTTFPTKSGSSYQDHRCWRPKNTLDLLSISPQNIVCRYK